MYLSAFFFSNAFANDRCAQNEVYDSATNQCVSREAVAEFRRLVQRCRNIEDLGERNACHQSTRNQVMGESGLGEEEKGILANYNLVIGLNVAASVPIIIHGGLKCSALSAKLIPGSAAVLAVGHYGNNYVYDKNTKEMVSNFKEVIGSIDAQNAAASDNQILALKTLKGQQTEYERRLKSKQLTNYVALAGYSGGLAATVVEIVKSAGGDVSDYFCYSKPGGGKSVKDVTKKVAKMVDGQIDSKLISIEGSRVCGQVAGIKECYDLKKLGVKAIKRAVQYVRKNLGGKKNSEEQTDRSVFYQISPDLRSDFYFDPIPFPSKLEELFSENVSTPFLNAVFPSAIAQANTTPSGDDSNLKKIISKSVKEEVADQTKAGLQEIGALPNSGASSAQQALFATPITRAVIAAGGILTTSIRAGSLAKELKKTGERIKLLEEKMQDFTAKGNLAFCSDADRQNPASTTCYCYSRDTSGSVIPNMTKKNEAVCLNDFRIRGYLSDHSGPRLGCISQEFRFDETCDCRATNSCATASTFFAGSIPDLGGAEKLFNGIGIGEGYSEANFDRIQMYARTNLQAATDKLKDIESPDLKEQVQELIEGSEQALNSPSQLANLMGQAGLGGTSEDAAEVDQTRLTSLATRQRRKEKSSQQLGRLGSAAGATNFEANSRTVASDDLAFNFPSYSSTTPPIQSESFPGKSENDAPEYDFTKTDASIRPEAQSLFNVLSNRYQKSALPYLVPLKSKN